MSTTNRMPVAAEPDRPLVHTSSRSGLADSILGTRGLMTIAALTVVSMILLVPLNYLAPVAEASQNAVLLGCATMGLQLIPCLLPTTVVRHPDTIMIATLLMGIMSTFITPAGPMAIISNLIGRVFVEVSLAILLYRKWTWWSLLILAAIFSLLNGVIYVSIMSAAMGVAPASTDVVIVVISALVSDSLTIALTQPLNRASVDTNHRMTGRA